MKISQVSILSGLSVDTLRYYERVGLLPPVTRHKSGIRDYSELDIRRVEFIKYMRNASLPIEVLTEYMQLALQGDGTVKKRRDMLREQREILAEKINDMQSTLNLLDHKISIYEEKMLGIEQELTQNDAVSIPA